MRGVFSAWGKERPRARGYAVTEYVIKIGADRFLAAAFRVSAPIETTPDIDLARAYVSRSAAVNAAAKVSSRLADTQTSVHTRASLKGNPA